MHPHQRGEENLLIVALNRENFVVPVAGDLTGISDAISSEVGAYGNRTFRHYPGLAKRISM